MAEQRSQWHPTPVLLPGKSHGWRNLEGCAVHGVPEGQTRLSDFTFHFSLFTFMHWRRKWQPTSAFLPGESQGRQSLVGCHLWGRTVGHDWYDLVAAASAADGQGYAMNDQTLYKFSCDFQLSIYNSCWTRWKYWVLCLDKYGITQI